MLLLMDLEKASDRVDRKDLWDLRRIYGVRGYLLEGIRSFYKDMNASLCMNGELSESFGVGVGVRQGCVMSPWLCNV